VCRVVLDVMYLREILDWALGSCPHSAASGGYGAGGGTPRVSGTLRSTIDRTRSRTWTMDLDLTPEQQLIVEAVHGLLVNH
jgi:hypothetical protein